MSKVTEAFSNSKAFIPFLTAGDPNIEKTENYILELEKAGADLIEIGIPFSDPITDTSRSLQNARKSASTASSSRICRMRKKAN